MALPNFIGIGAQKAGTTPLYFLLQQHPDIFLHPQKETHFFSRLYHNASAHFYEWSVFAGYRGQRAVGEISPEYMRTPGVARAIRAALGRVKIIICLREPLARAFSHYLHCLRSAEDNRSFFDACREDARLPLWSDSKDDLARAYVRGSWYPYQIEEWRREFGAENLFVCVLERDFADNSAKARLIRRLFAFLDVSSSGVAVNLDIPNTSGPAPKIIFVDHSMMAGSGREPIALEPGDIIVQAGNFRRLLRRPSPPFRSFFEKMARELTPHIAPEAERGLRQCYFADVAERVSELIREDLTAIWGKPTRIAAKPGRDTKEPAG